MCFVRVECRASRVPCFLVMIGRSSPSARERTRRGDAHGARGRIVRRDTSVHPEFTTAPCPLNSPLNPSRGTCSSRRRRALRARIARARGRDWPTVRAREISRSIAKIRREDRALARVACVVRASRMARGARDGWGEYVCMYCGAMRRGGAVAVARERGRWARG